MKKAFTIIVSLILVLCLVSCLGNTEKPTVTIPETYAEIPVTSSETYNGTPVTFRPVFGEGEEITLSPDDSAYIKDIVKNGKWNTDGTSHSLSDAIFTVDGKDYYYHVSCSTFYDYGTEQNLKLTKSQAGRINDILGPLSNLYGEDEAVQLSVEINPSIVKHGESFVLTAKATNLTGETIYVSLPTGTPDMHYEIRVEIEDESGKRFVDLDTQGKAFTCDEKTISLENGETITQVMNMSPGYLIDGSMYPMGEEIKYFPAGTYKGSATFFWHDRYVPDIFEYGEEHRKVIEFEIPVYEIQSDTADSFR